MSNGIRRVAIRRRNRTPVYSGDRKRCDAICFYATRFAVHNSRNSSLRDSMRLDATRYVYCEPAFTREIRYNIYTRTPTRLHYHARLCARVPSKRILTKFVSIGSYSPEVRSFRTLITSTKVFSLIIICKSL